MGLTGTEAAPLHRHLFPPVLHQFLAEVAKEASDMVQFLEGKKL